VIEYAIFLHGLAQ